MSKEWNTEHNKMELDRNEEREVMMTTWEKEVVLELNKMQMCAQIDSKRPRRANNKQKALNVEVR